MNNQERVLAEITAWTLQGNGVTRATLCGSMSKPPNEITPRVTELLKKGLVIEEGFVHSPSGRRRALLWATA